jgi:hypothetical protein
MKNRTKLEISFMDTHNPASIEGNPRRGELTEREEEKSH